MEIGRINASKGESPESYTCTVTPTLQVFFTEYFKIVIILIQNGITAHVDR